MRQIEIRCVGGHVFNVMNEGWLDQLEDSEMEWYIEFIDINTKRPIYINSSNIITFRDKWEIKED